MCPILEFGPVRLSNPHILKAETELIQSWIHPLRLAQTSFFFF